MEYIITFHTHFDALQCDRFLKLAKIKGRLQPVPRELSSSCGTCIKFNTDRRAADNIELADLEFEKLFKIDSSGYVLLIDNE